MTATLPYIRERDGVFQYERRVPQHVRQDPAWYERAFQSRPLFRRSMKTKSRTAALAAYQAIDAEFERLKQPIVSPVAVLPSFGSVRLLTDKDLEAVAERYAALTALPFEKLHRRANVSIAAAAELERLESNLEIDGETIRAALRARIADPNSPILQPVTEAPLVAAEHGFFAPDGSDEQGALIAAIRIGLEQGYKRIAALSQGDALPRLETPVAALKPPQHMTLAEAVERYVSDRKPPVKAAAEIRLALRQFEEAAGRKSLTATTRDDVHRFVERLADQTVGGKTPGSVIRKLSEHSIRKRLRMLSAAVNHARDRGVFNGDNMMRDIRVGSYVKNADKAVMPDKRRLQVAELNAIFAHPWFTGCRSASDTLNPGKYRLSGAHFWVPVVALFTGCRAAELGGLKLNEVVLDDPHPHLIIRDNEYRRTKSKRSRRVPLLDPLLALGFSTYVASVRSNPENDRLFPDWTARRRKGAGKNDFPAWSNANIIRSFNRSVIPTTLASKLPSDARREVTFHSLRGAFKAMLSAGNNVPPVVINEVVGHANSELDERYIGGLSIEETYPLVRACNFKGLVIPSCPKIDCPEASNSFGQVAS